MNTKRIIFTNEVDKMIMEIVRSKPVISFHDYYNLIVEVRKNIPEYSLYEIKQRVRIFFKLFYKYIK